MTQRETYKLIERVLSADFESELALLKALVQYIVDRTDLQITSGRIWMLLANREAYELVFSHGDVAHLPEAYVVEIADQPVFYMLESRRTVVNYETDALLLQKGIKLYSATGVGELERRGGARFYHYALAFNSSQPDHDFFDLMNVIGAATSTALRNFRQRQKQAKFLRELDQASEIQRSLLPDHTMNFFDYNVYGVSVPDDVVGGDYFDYLRYTDEEDRVGIVISDAASKGLPAAIQALFVSGALRMAMGYSTKISSLISQINTVMYHTFPYERFVTLFYCELTSSKNGLVLFANAGHTSPLHYRAKDNTVHLLNPTGGILGIAPEQKFRVENINMGFGDVLLLITDGIADAQDRNGNLFGNVRLAQFLKDNAMADAKTLAHGLLQEVQDFSVGSTYSDDSTVVVIKRGEQNKETKYETVTEEVHV